MSVEDENDQAPSYPALDAGELRSLRVLLEKRSDIQPVSVLYCKRLLATLDATSSNAT